ncbi:MAG: YncE family protein [Bryobacteraceae bacterium]
MQRKHRLHKIALGCLFAAALAPAESLLVLNKNGSVAVVDPSTQKVVARITAGERPHEIVAAGTNLAVISNYEGGHTLSVIDLKSKKELRRADLSPSSRPHGLAYSGGQVYFTAEGSGSIGRYDPVANRVDWTMLSGQSGTHMILVSKDGAKLFTSNLGSGSVSIFEKAGSSWKPAHIQVGPGAEGFDLSPDEKQIWAANAGDGTVSVIDVAAKKVVATVNIGAERPNRLKFTPDGKIVLVSDFSNGNLIVIDANSRNVTKRVKVASSIAGILIAPDGLRAYTAATSDNFVAVIDLRTLEAIGRIMTGEGPDGMDWIRGN